MGSRKGLMRRMRGHEIVLMVPKKSEPMTKAQIDQFFDNERRVRGAYRKERD